MPSGALRREAGGGGGRDAIHILYSPLEGEWRAQRGVGGGARSALLRWYVGDFAGSMALTRLPPAANERLYPPWGGCRNAVRREAGGGGGVAAAFQSRLARTAPNPTFNTSPQAVAPRKFLPKVKLLQKQCKMAGMVDKDEAEKKGIRTVDGNTHLDAQKAERLEKLRQLLPEAVNGEGQVDVKALRDALGDPDSRSNDQGYELTFAGKGLARAQADSPTEYELKAELQQSCDFDTTANVVIRGDNLDVLKILYQNYFGKVKMIYIDPPYNTQTENFVYNDYFKATDSDLIAKHGLSDGAVESLHNLYGTRSHSGWLAFMYPRLKLARELLCEDGVIFISIDDNEQAPLKLICNEIFGEENVDCLVWHKAGDGRYGKMKNTQTARKDHEYVVVAYKRAQKLNKLWDYPQFQKTYTNLVDDPRGNYMPGSISRKEDASNPDSANYYEVTSPAGKKFKREFDVTKEEFDRLDADGRIFWGAKQDAVPRIKVFINERRFVTPSSLICKGSTYEGTRDLEGILPGVGASNLRPKPTSMLFSLVQLATGEDDIVLDFFAGSGTTAEATMRLNMEDGGNRKFILVQLDEDIKRDKSPETYEFCAKNGIPPVISSLTIERLKCARDKILGEHGELISKECKPSLDLGFKVYSAVPKPKLVERKANKGAQLVLNNQRVSALDILTNMLCATCKPLDTPIECLVENLLYEADNELYLLGKVPQDALAPHKGKGKKVNLNGWADISLTEFLNFGFHGGNEIEKVSVVY